VTEGPAMRRAGEARRQRMHPESRIETATPGRFEGSMKVLITGHHGYIGSVMAGVLIRAGHDVTGLDTYLYEGCTFGDEAAGVASIRKDVRDVEPADLLGFDAVIHLAALSNDP